MHLGPIENDFLRISKLPVVVWIYVLILKKEVSWNHKNPKIWMRYQKSYSPTLFTQLINENELKNWKYFITVYSFFFCTLWTNFLFHFVNHLTRFLQLERPLAYAKVFNYFLPQNLAIFLFLISTHKVLGNWKF